MRGNAHEKCPLTLSLSPDVTDCKCNADRGGEGTKPANFITHCTSMFAPLLSTGNTTYSVGAAGTSLLCKPVPVQIT